ncbi:MAG: hypothetical protein HKM00_09560 [Gallionella sp.]|nr:hypothetical protein [Gallionella sp.]
MQYDLIHESINDALREVVQALGGTKKVGMMMRPEKTIDDAARWLSDCLNQERREKLDPEQVLWLLREAQKIGCHGAMNFIGNEAGYAVSVIEPLDEMAQLKRQIIDSTQLLSRMAERIELLSKNL